MSHPAENPRGRLRAFGPDLWLAEGPVVRFMGAFPYPTRMALARLEDGSLWVWSPIALDEDLATEVEALGPVRHLVAPNKLHHLFLADWKSRFGEAALYAPPGLERKRPDLSFHERLGDRAPQAWAGQIEQLVFGGSLVLDEILFFHRASRSLLVCDLIQRFERDQVSGPSGWLMRLWGLVGEDGSTPREWRASFWRRGEARAAKARALEWDPERVVIAHGRCAPRDGRAVLERGLRWLG